jgi:hypothetical protein
MEKQEFNVPDEIKSQGYAVEQAWLTEQRSVANVKKEVQDEGKAEPEKKVDPEAAKPEPEKKGDEGSQSAEINWAEILGQDYKTKDEVLKANIPDKLKKLSELERERAELETKMKALEESVSSSENPFADEVLYKINEFAKKTGRKDFDVIGKIFNSDIATMPDIDVLILKEIYDNPKRAGQEDVIREKILSRYGLDEDIDREDATEEEVAKYEKRQRLAKIGIEDDAVKAKSALEKVRTEIAPFKTKSQEERLAEQEAKKKDYEKQVQTYKDGWAKVITEGMSKIDDLPIFVPKADGVDKLLDFKIPADKKAEYMKKAIDIVTAGGLPLKEESLDAAYTVYRNLIEADNRASIYEAIGKHYRSLTSEEWEKVTHNPSALKLGTETKDKPNLSFAEKNKEEQKKALKDIGY